MTLSWVGGRGYFLGAATGGKLPLVSDEHLPEDPDFGEELARITAHFDQMGESMARFATPSRRYYDALMQVGFTEEQAFAMLLAWQQSFYASAF